MTKNKLREEELLEKIRQGEREAFGQVYDIYIERIYRFIYFKVSSRETAQDLTSECFLKVFEHLIERSEEMVNLRAFIYRVARNLVIDYYRSRDKQPVELNEARLQVTDDLGEKTEEKFARAENMKKIAAALIKLKAEWQEAIILRYIEDYKLGEVSTIINKNPGAVRVMIHRALKALKREIDREGQSNSL